MFPKSLHLLNVLGDPVIWFEPSDPVMDELRPSLTSSASFPQQQTQSNSDGDQWRFPMDSVGGASGVGGSIDPRSGPFDPCSASDRFPSDPRLVHPRSTPDRPRSTSNRPPIERRSTPDRPPIEPRRYPFRLGYPYGPKITKVNHLCQQKPVSRRNLNSMSCNEANRFATTLKVPLSLASQPAMMDGSFTILNQKHG